MQILPLALYARKGKFCVSQIIILAALKIVSYVSFAHLW